MEYDFPYKSNFLAKFLLIPIEAEGQKLKVRAACAVSSLFRSRTRSLIFSMKREKN